MRLGQTIRLCGAMLFGLCLPPGHLIAEGATQPETVMVTFRARAGVESQLERVIALHWSTALKLKLVRKGVHLSLRGIEEDDKAYFVEIFTWRYASVPDAAPPEIRDIWDQMNRLVEARGGRPGLEFVPVSLPTK